MIKYVIGDATKPPADGRERFIIHVCNDRKVWGAGFVLAVSRAWPEVKDYYFATRFLNLGDVQFVKVGYNLTVCNMIAQTLGVKDDRPPIRYWALRKCLEKVYQAVVDTGGTIHAPRFGAGLAGGDWDIIEEMINTQLPDCDVYIYDLK